MITPRMRRRRRLLDTYVRVELENLGVSFDDRACRLHQESLGPRPEAGDENHDDEGDARQERQA